MNVLTMSKERDIKALNAANELGVLPLLFAECISADVLINEVACDKAIEKITDFLEAIDETDIQDKGKWKDLLEKGLEVAKRDKAEFLKGNSAKNV